MIFLLVFLALSGCGNNQEAANPPEDLEPVEKITIGYIAMVASSPQALINREQKLFEKAFADAGYENIEWVITRGRDNVGPMMEEGTFHFLYTPINNFTAYFTETSQFAAGDNYRIIAGSSAVAEGSALLVNESITDISDLDGKVIGIVNNSYSHEMLLNLQLDKAGLSTDTVGGTVQIQFQDYLMTFYEMFEDGEFDGIIVRQNEVERLLDRFPTAHKLLGLTDNNVVGDLIPNVWLYARTDVLDHYPELVRIMLETHVELTAAAEANRDLLPQLADETQDYYYYEIIKAENYEKPPLEDMARQWQRVHITYDPDADFAEKLHRFILDSGYTDKPYSEFADFTHLNAILAK